MARPGDEITLEVIATSRSETPIDFFDLTFEGEESVSVLNDSGAFRDARTIVKKVERLRDKGTLSEGEHRFEAHFTVPVDAPGSYTGVMTTIRYEVRLHVSIPWWPDLRETYELLVEPHGEVRPPPRPASATSKGSSGTPFIEVSLTDTTFAPNDEVNGAFAAGNLGRDMGDGVEVSLVGLEQARCSGRVFRAEQTRHNVPTVFQVPRSGREAPFRFRVPKDATPSFQSETCKLEWSLSATLRLSSGGAVTTTLPVVIGRHAGGRAGAGKRPEIGAVRWRAGWSAAGEAYGMSVEPDHLCLAGARGDVKVQIVVEESDDEAALAATFTYPSVMLGLRVTPQLIVMLPTPLEVMFSGYRIEHREHEQALSLLGGRVHEALDGVKLVSADDTSVVVRAPVAGYDRDSIAPFVRQAATIAAALASAIDQVPAPASMRDALPAWRAFAAATGGRLTPGAMVLQGANVDDAVFEVRTVLGPDGDPKRTRVAMRIDPPLPLRGPIDATSAELPPGGRELVEVLRAAVAHLEIRPKALAIELPGGTMDPAALRPRMIEMLVLARRLRGDRSPGPYR